MLRCIYSSFPHLVVPGLLAVLPRCAGLLADACAATGTTADAASSSMLPPVVAAAAAGKDLAATKTLTATNSTCTTTAAPAASSVLDNGCSSVQAVRLQTFDLHVFVELLLLLVVGWQRRVGLNLFLS